MKKQNKQKMKKNVEKRKKKEEIWLRTQNPRRFPRFTVVVVTFFVEIQDDFHDFVSECVLPEENEQPVLRGHVFS